MVKELEDSPRDEVAVLLDGDPAGVAGSPPDSSFDVAVRVAGSILLAQVRRGRRCVLLLNTAGREMQVVSSDGPEWQRALELLAAAEPDARSPAADAARSADGPAARSLELVVVTSRVERTLVDRLLERALTRRPVALVHVEAESFAGEPAPSGARAPAPAGGGRADRRRAAGRRSRVLCSRGRPRQRWRVRSAARTVAVSAPPSWSIAVAWLRLEQPLGSLWRAVALLALALAAALPRRRSLRVLSSPWSRRSSLRGSRWESTSSRGGSTTRAGASRLFGTRFGNGFADFYGTHLPFDPRVHVAMHELVLSGLFLFALGVALLAAERKPIAGALVLLVGAGWPATLLGSSHGLAMGAAILGAALVLLAGLGSRRAAGPGAAGGGRRGGRGRRGRLRHCRPPRARALADLESRARRVRAGRRRLRLERAVRRPRRGRGSRSTVLQVQSERPPTYLRAAVLDDFVDDAWVLGAPRPADSLEPPAAFRPQNETREVVTVNALADTHLAGGSIPIRFEAAGGAPLVRLEPGFAALNQDLPRGFRYTVWSYTARPSRGRTAPVAAGLPARCSRDGRSVDVGDGDDVAAVRNAGPRRRRRHARSPPTRELRRVSAARAPRGEGRRRRAHPVRRGRRPRELVRRLAARFHYSNHPPVIKPALVGFVTKTHAGYCQYFAGAMALMLRYLGIPARVAVGFAGGTYDSTQRVWNITDRDAHAWVEVWFKGYGWLPFDPTPAAPGAAPRQTQAGLRGGGEGPGGSARLRPIAKAGARDTIAGRAEAERATTDSARVRRPARSPVGSGRWWWQRQRRSHAGRRCFCSPSSPWSWAASCWRRPVSA